ncbi:uncharacterized protein LOC123307138 [Coccinella septempunctata]|uniref:uncharacterized protein LOC123307138 n=1 Tax=Coccinella septempunctata TaxID=41139 RepID=UPI001D0817B3|nr:uncharacterized protein LOC123307138 [Coccinella septempunctata]
MLSIDMGGKQFLIIFVVSLGISTTNQRGLPCSASSYSSQDVYWPDIEDGTCSASIPGCTNSEGYMEIRCCDDGQSNEIHCVRNDTIQDPRCHGNMRSTIGNVNIEFCFELVNHTTYPFKCTSKTGLMITPNVTTLTTIGGSDTGIWLPVEKYINSLRYTTVNPSYMDFFGDILPVHPSKPCVILIGGKTKVVSCNEHYLGICLDYPFSIYRVRQTNELDTLLSDVKVFCWNEINEFCSFFKQGYHMNLIYFSSRLYAAEPYIVLQKSNLRLILQIRKNDPPQVDGTVYLHVALSETDWDIFKNTSFPLTPYESTNETLYIAPKVMLYANDTSLTINEINSNNIKWTQKEEYTHYIFCFFSVAPEYNLEKFEVLATYQIDLKNKHGILRCDAFDHDLKITTSNVITLGNQNISHYISEMTVSVDAMISCDEYAVKDRILASFVDSMENGNFHFDIEINDILLCNFSNLALVDIIVYWYPKIAAQRIEEIEEEYTTLNSVIQKISENGKMNHLNISTTKFLRHSSYCMEETTPIGNFSFVWPTTPSDSSAASSPFCYKNNGMQLVRRPCYKEHLGSYWLSDIEYCKPVANLTQLLQEIYLGVKLSKSGILHNLNMAILQYNESFHVQDVNLLSKIVGRLDGVSSELGRGLKNLSLLINNLGFIRNEVLKVSQEIYQTTDSIMNSSDALYLNTRGGQSLTESNHCYYTINFTEYSTATGIILRISGNIHEINLLKSNTPQLELTQDDEFEAAIFFDDDFWSLLSLNENMTTVKFSIFFENYLFDVDHPLVTTKAIFKVLVPDEMKQQVFTTFLVIKTQTGGEICSCWKYANSNENTFESKWYRTPKFEIGSYSFCLFKSQSYCTIFMTDSEDSDGYVAGFLAEYVPLHDLYSIRSFLSICSIFEHYYHMNRTTYDIKSVQSLPNNLIQIVVVWMPELPARTIPEIEKEYDDLKQYIQESSNNVPKNGITRWMYLEYFRNRRYCLRESVVHHDSTFSFRTTTLNDSASPKPSCLRDSRMVQRKCKGNYSLGAFWDKFDPNVCVSCSSYITKSLAYLLEHFSADDTNKVLNDLEQITEEAISDFDPIDFYLLSEIFFLISNSTTISYNLDIQSVTAVTSNIQEMNKDVLRNAQLQFNATDNILASLDRILLKSNVTLHKMSRFATLEFKLNRSEGLILQRDGNDYNISVIYGAMNNPYLLEAYENFEGAVFFNDFADNDSVIVSIFFEDVLFVDSKWRHRVSLIFGILLPNTNKMCGTIELVFKNEEGKERACAYWKYGVENSVNISGRWKNESEPNDKLQFSTCIFNHTTHFAMLINDDSSDPLYLEIVTNIGCFLSIIGLLGILITGLIFERWRKNLGNIILMNFVFTVAIQICLYYLSGYIHEVISESDSCILIGALLHYAVISEFCWMLIIAILQFKRFVQVLTRPPKYVLFKSFLIGWGFPLVPVLCVLLIDSANYTSSMTGLCYPSKIGLYFGVWLPILVITFINFVIFSYIMYSICNRKTECVDTVSNEVIFQWRLAVLLFFMLGLTWSFAIASEFMLREIFAYLFCITSTLQGFIMFLFFIVFNERTRILYSVLFSRIFKK